MGEPGWDVEAGQERDAVVEHDGFDEEGPGVEKENGKEEGESGGGGW